MSLEYKVVFLKIFLFTDRHFATFITYRHKHNVENKLYEKHENNSQRVRSNNYYLNSRKILNANQDSKLQNNGYIDNQCFFTQRKYYSCLRSCKKKDEPKTE